MITTIQEAAAAAVQVQDACNLTGVLRSFAEAMTVVRAASNAGGHGTDWINRHPVAQLFADKIADLTGRPDFAGYSAAYEACQKLSFFVDNDPTDDEPDTSRPHVAGCPRAVVGAAECLCDPARTALEGDAQ